MVSEEDSAVGEPRYRRPEPAVEFEDLVRALHAADDPDVAALDIGTEWLESLLHGQRGQELWPQVDELARRDPVFRRALRDSWSFSPDAPPQHEPLMWELGEWRSVAVRFIVYSDRIGESEPCNFRALEVDSPLSGFELARLLREAADDVEGEARRDAQTRADWPELGGNLPTDVAMWWLRRTASDLALETSEDEAGSAGWGDEAWLRSAVEHGQGIGMPLSPAHHAALLRDAVVGLRDAPLADDLISAITLRIGRCVDRLVRAHPEEVWVFDTFLTDHLFAAMKAEAGDAPPEDPPAWWSGEARLRRVRQGAGRRLDRPGSPDPG